MGNYKGYFNDLNCKKYEVRITASGDTSAYQEILLAGQNPFVVRYNKSKTPFDPVRTSTATISIVHDDYLYDALSNCAQGTKVELIDITTNTASTVWVGYMTPKVYNAGYDSCIESFELDAADCISSLQYVDYEEMNGGGVTSIKSILNQICDATGELEGYYWTRSKKVGNTILLPNHMSISEHNFQTNDTEEYWKLDEILEEICRYLGFTCLQHGKRMYFIDYQYLEDHNDIYATFFPKANSYGPSLPEHLDGAYVVSKDSYRGTGASISMEPVYNKVTVNANMYAIEDFIPNPFDDVYLVNRISSANTYASVEIIPPLTKASYPHGSEFLGIGQNYKEEKEDDTKYRYFIRPYDNKHWESVYSDKTTGNYIELTDVQKASSAVTKDYRGATLVDFGRVEKPYKSETQQYIVPSKLDYTRYLCICEKHTNDSSFDQHGDINLDKGADKVVYRLKNGYKPMSRIDNKCFLVLNCSAIWERYEDRNYINPDWCDTECKQRGTMGGEWHNRIARPFFRIHIGNKGWSSTWNEWVNSGTTWDYCTPAMRWDEKTPTYWNHEIEILNNVSWEDKVNCEGIKIPLSGIDTTQEIHFEIINPAPSFYGNTGNPDFEHKFYQYNAYCWMKDLSVKVAREGESDLGEDSDVIYENEIDECSVNEMGEIRVRITTLTDKVRPSYSHMLYGSGFIETIKEESLGQSTGQKPEENIVQKYVHQYSTPTKLITLTIGDGIKQFQKLFGVDVDNMNMGYVPLGTEIDYRMGRQTITVIEKDK